MARNARKMLLVPLVLTSLAPSGIGQQPSPDLILLNGRIFTSDLSHPYVEALAIRGDRITAAGTSEKIVSLAGPQTKRVDLDGATGYSGNQRHPLALQRGTSQFPIAIQKHGSGVARSGGPTIRSRRQGSERNGHSSRNRTNCVGGPAGYEGFARQISAQPRGHAGYLVATCGNSE